MFHNIDGLNWKLHMTIAIYNKFGLHNTRWTLVIPLDKFAREFRESIWKNEISGALMHKRDIDSGIFCISIICNINGPDDDSDHFYQCNKYIIWNKIELYNLKLHIFDPILQIRYCYHNINKSTHYPQLKKEEDIIGAFCPHKFQL